MIKLWALVARYSHIFFFVAAFFFSSPFRSHLHRPFVLPSCVMVGIKLSCSMLCVFPPRRTSPCTDVFQCRPHRLWPCVASPSHGSPHAFGNHLRHETKLHLFPNRPWCQRCPRAIHWQYLNTRLIAIVSQPLMISRIASLPICSRNRRHCRLGPPIFCISLSMVRLCVVFDYVFRRKRRISKRKKHMCLCACSHEGTFETISRHRPHAC